MAKIKGLKAGIAIATLILLIGLSYAAITKEPYIGSYTSGKSSVAVTNSEARDYERNIYLVNINENSNIAYSVTQTKDLKATMDGITPKNVVAQLGDTVNLRVVSDVNCNFVVDGYRIAAKVWPDTTTEISFNTDKLGTYAFRCAGFLNKDVGLLEVIR